MRLYIENPVELFFPPNNGCVRLFTFFRTIDSLFHLMSQYEAICGYIVLLETGFHCECTQIVADIQPLAVCLWQPIVLIVSIVDH
jgi:hypothetical protein